MARLASGSLLGMLFIAGSVFAQTDPGVQSASRGTGATIINPSNDPNGFTAFFNDGLSRFQDVEDVSAAPNNGLGPRFNSNQCSSCHAQPAVGGSGAATNPQAGFAGNGIAPGNEIPSFITSTGPTREARFPYMMNSNGTVDTGVVNGGVETLFTVAGRSDKGTCGTLAQPNFNAAINANNIVYRIPTPLFGAGLVENLDDSTLLHNQAANLVNSFGITGTFNHSGNDGTITRFGWKAQNKSLHIFAGEAYNVEMGITNELFPNERPLPEEDQLGTGLVSSCLNLTGSGYPEDTSNPKSSPNSAVLDDVSAFANFMRFLAPPPQGAVIFDGSQVSQSTLSAGLYYFDGLGCSTCHNASPGTTQVSNFAPALSGVAVNSFSDFEIHDMGTTLADNITQGNAGGSQFRTAPLWGLGQRIFLLHDGRTTNLVTAILDHSSNGSEANTAVTNYTNLNSTHQQDLLDYLRSL